MAEYGMVSIDEARRAINCLVETELFEQIYYGQLKGEQAKSAINEFVTKYAEIYFELSVDEIIKIARTKINKMIADRESDGR